VMVSNPLGGLKKTAFRFRLYPDRNQGRRLLRELDPDAYAARIVLKRGISQVGQGVPELEPADTGPLPIQTAGGPKQVDAAGTARHETGAGSPRIHPWEDVAERGGSGVMLQKHSDLIRYPAGRI
jgi:hypothetical protein